jgi:hypothetical protein
MLRYKLTPATIDIHIYIYVTDIHLYVVTQYSCLFVHYALRYIVRSKPAAHAQKERRVAVQQQCIHRQLCGRQERRNGRSSISTVISPLPYQTLKWTCDTNGSGHLPIVLTVKSTAWLYQKCPAGIHPCDSLKGILIEEFIILQLTCLHFNLHFCVKKICQIMAI